MHRRLTETERRLWARAMRDVRLAPGKARPEIEPEETPPTPAAVKPGAGSAPVSARPSAPRVPGPPQDVSTHRRIRRGQAEIEARLDLHGHTHDAALAELSAFLRRSQAMGARCVLVITGKGRAGGGLIRSRLLDWLSGPELRAMIAGYSQAHRQHGGDGAFYVLLKSKRD